MNLVIQALVLKKHAWLMCTINTSGVFELVFGRFCFWFSRDPSLTSLWEWIAAGSGMRAALLTVPETMRWYNRNTWACVFSLATCLCQSGSEGGFEGLEMLKASLTHGSAEVTTVHHTSSHTAPSAEQSLSSSNTRSLLFLSTWLPKEWKQGCAVYLWSHC